MRTVGIHGWYWDGNLGDVLMAVMHAEVLRARGYRVLVQRLPAPVAREFSLETTEDAEEFARRSDVVVYGGGGLLTRAHRDRRLTGPFEGDSMAILSAVERRRIPLFLCSVGGDGEDIGGWRPWQEGFLTIARGLSLRNQADVPWVSKRNAGCVWHHDIVWQTPEFLRDGKPPSRKPGVLLQWPPARMRLLTAALAAVCEKAGKLTRFHGAWFEWTQGVETRIAYSKTLSEDIGLIRSASCVLSGRLHMGMIALSYGVPYLPFLPVPKCEVMLRQIGWQGRVIRSRVRGAGCLASIAVSRSVAALGNVLCPETLAELRRGAAGHWSWLLSQIEAA